MIRGPRMTTSTKRILAALGAALVALFAVAFAVNAYQGGNGGTVVHQYMTVEEMKADGGLIVDIRTPPEWRETGVIDGAKLVTFSDAQSFLAQVGPEIADGRDLILICHSGNRSSRAAAALEGLIPNKIISVDGGMSREIASGLQTVAPVAN